MRHVAVLVAITVCAACGGGGSFARGNDAGRGDGAVDVVTNAPDDAATVTGAGTYGDAGFVSENPDAACPSRDCHRAEPGCVSAETCNDGIDNDCDGVVDEDCSCLPGDVQRCLRAPPGASRGGALQGACSFGHQTCQGAGEFGVWGECSGGIAPASEVCDGLDNNCNGCVDEGLCCATTGTCPGPGDPRIPTGQPFTTLMLDGTRFASGDRYVWHVEGGPCDQLLYATTGHVSYKLNGTEGVDATGPTLGFAPTLSGDYTVHLTIYHGVDIALDCTFIVPIRADGLRVEMCWDTTGMNDVDLWMHRATNRNPWFTPDATSLGGGYLPRDVCGWSTCRMGVDWGYPATPSGACARSAGNCPNPRLDVDNISRAGIPENINLDNPQPGETFRVAVNFFGGRDMPVHPMVNLYCGGELRATYGGADVRGRRIGAEPVSGFDTKGTDRTGSLWRVVDVTMQSARECSMQPLHPSGARSGYCVNTGTDRTFDGPCSR